jgi:hypothetical protein
MERCQGKFEANLQICVTTHLGSRRMRVECLASAEDEHSQLKVAKKGETVNRRFFVGSLRGRRERNCT